MNRDTRFVNWHNNHAPEANAIDSETECDCWLGVLWDLAETYAQAERIAARHPGYLETAPT